MNCQVCGASNPDSSIHCYRCGATLATEKPSRATRPAKGGGKLSGKGLPGKSISSDYPRPVAHKPKKKKLKKRFAIAGIFGSTPGYKSTKKKSAKKGPTKRGPRK